MSRKHRKPNKIDLFFLDHFNELAPNMKSSFDACLVALKKIYEQNPKIEFELTSTMTDNGIIFYCSIHDKDDGYVKFNKGLSSQEAFVKSLYFYLTGDDLKENIYAQ